MNWNRVQSILKWIKKAVVAGVTAFLGAYGTAYVSGNEVTQDEWGTIALTVLAAIAAVYKVKNGPKPYHLRK